MELEFFGILTCKVDYVILNIDERARNDRRGFLVTETISRSTFSVVATVGLGPGSGLFTQD